LEDSDSWRTFFDMYWQLLYNVARKSGLANDQAEDVVQETVIAVARKMPEFRYDPAKGSFKRWLLLICRRRIQDYFRRLYSSGRPQQQATEELVSATENVPASTLPPDAEIDGIWEQEWRDNIFRAALARVRQRANPKQYQVFDCCVLQNQRPAEVARMLGLNAAQVYLAKHRLSAAVKRAVNELEVEMGGGRAGIELP
jgi:RNA polymerase sigma-70 factor (ECF subfamily)